MNTTHPQWIQKFVHNSKIHAVKIVTWEDHTELATVPHVYEICGEKSEGAKAADLIVASPELLEAAEALLAKIDSMTSEQFSRGEERPEREALRAAIAKAKG